MNRRIFIQKAGLGSLVMSSGAFPLMAMHDPNIARLTILHTNDVHSRVEAFPMDGGRNAGQGGASRRASLIKKIRSKKSIYCYLMPEIYSKGLHISIISVVR